LREKELEQFAGISEEWLQREENYKAEIKRLELFLAKESKDGMASVALARSESIVDRAGSKRFHARVKRVSNSQNQGTLLALHLPLAMLLVQKRRMLMIQQTPPPANRQFHNLGHKPIYQKP
jgi:hypothetical protein